MRRGRDKLAARRRALGHTQESLAELLEVAVSTVARWEQGAGCPLPSLRRPLSEALSVSLEGLDRLLSGGDAPEDEATVRDGRPRTPAVAIHHDESSAKSLIHEGILLSASRPVPAGPPPSSKDAGHDAAAIRAFRAADRKIGGAHLYGTVVRYLHTEVAPRLFGVARSDDSKLAFTAAAGLTEMAGWMAHDAGDDSVATQHFDRALDLVHLGEDRQLGGHVLASMSHLADHLGKPHEAIGLARAGQEMASLGPANPDLHAHLLAMEARGLAALGESSACAQVLLQAETTLGGEPADTPSPWISHFDEGSLASEAARCMHRLGYLDEAQKQAERVIAVRPVERARSRALGQLLLARVLVARGRPDEACALGYDVLATTQSLGSFVVVRELEELQQKLDPYRSTRLVDEFLSCLAEALREWRWLYSCRTIGEVGHERERQMGGPGGA